MRLRHLELLILGLIASICMAMVVWTFAVQQREIERLNRELVASKQEVARQTYKYYEAYLRSGAGEEPE